MGNKILFILILAFAEIALAQDLKMCGYQGYQTVVEVENACDLQGAKSTSSSAEGAEKKVDAILDKVGLFRNFFIEECKDINNALAVTMPLDGGAIDRYILYDQSFFDKVSTSTGTDWGNTSILAHEVGHHLNGHTLSGKGSTHNAELQADEFSGFVLARMKCSLEDAQSAVSNLLPDKASSTHPAKQDRLNAIAKGWNRGKGNKIEVKKIEEENDEVKITAEMVLANYIEAIGGQENVKKIKTFLLEQDLTAKDFEFNLEQSFLKPMTIILKVDYLGNITEQLVKNNKKYQKNNEGNWSILQANAGGDYTSNRSGSYIEEYSFLVMNTPVTYKGIVNFEDQNCYELKFLKEETGSIMADNELTVNSNQTSKFYSVKTGLLVGEKIETEIKTFKRKRLINTEKLLATTVFSNYRNVEGVLFPFLRVATSKNNGVDEKLTLVTNKIEINPSSIQSDDYDID